MLIFFQKPVSVESVVEVSNWKKSDHAKAMNVAIPQTVLGDFNNRSVTHFSQKVLFSKHKDKFKITFTEGGKTSHYEVAYTFGHYPLQQYLIEIADGQYQIFPFAWDSRPDHEGGQIWFPIYNDEDIHPNDRLHWKQKLQNWNGMCADCHSDGVSRNFDVTNNRFNTKWDNINVGCQSCHDNVKGHEKKAHASQPKIKTKPLLSWQRKTGEMVARLRNEQGELANKTQKQQHQKGMDVCFSCHALRTPITDGFNIKTAFLNQFTPAFPSTPLYYADGQIKEEVYVYGSFLQSKMFQQGVTCLNCHDAHTMKLKYQGNGVCLQCHNPVDYQTTKHTNHQLSTSAGQCVSCHMPTQTFMGVDKRRDHSFKIPKPHLSDKFDTPNACIQCHIDKSNQWATKTLNQWFGPPNTPQLEVDYLALQKGLTLPLQRHLAIIGDPNNSDIKKATAISLLPNTTKSLPPSVATPWIKNQAPLVRLAAAQIGYLIPFKELRTAYNQLLDDEFKAIRVAAANTFVTASQRLENASHSSSKELMQSLEVNSWRGEGLLNKSIVSQNQGQLEQTIETLKQSINIDPYFTPAYINLTDIYRATNQDQKSTSIYRDALIKLPNDPQLNFAYGMYLVRQKQKNQAVKHFQIAFRLDNSNLQYAYFYLLALDAIGNTKQALDILKQHYANLNAQEFQQLGLSFSQKLNDVESFRYFQNAGIK